MTEKENASEKIWQTTENVVTRKIADEIILVPISGNLANMQRIFTVNEVGASFLAMMDGKKSVSEIRQGLLDEFDVDENLLKKDLFAFIDQLKASELIMAKSV